MAHTNKSWNEPFHHLYSPVHIITTILHTRLPMTDQSLKPVITELHILFLDQGPDSPSFLSATKGASCIAPSVECTAGVVRWRGPTALLSAWQLRTSRRIFVISFSGGCCSALASGLAVSS